MSGGVGFTGRRLHRSDRFPHAFKTHQEMPPRSGIRVFAVWAKNIGSRMSYKRRSAAKPIWKADTSTHLSDEFPTGYSLTRCSPAELVSASPVGVEHAPRSGQLRGSLTTDNTSKLKLHDSGSTLTGQFSCPKVGVHLKHQQVPELFRPVRAGRLWQSWERRNIESATCSRRLRGRQLEFPLSAPLSIVSVSYGYIRQLIPQNTPSSKTMLADEIGPRIVRAPRRESPICSQLPSIVLSKPALLTPRLILSIPVVYSR